MTTKQETPATTEHKYDPRDHLIKVKGGALYLPVKNRISWLRDLYPGATIVTDLVTLDLELNLAVFKATVTLPEGGYATGYGSETEKDFPAGWIEKAETKAIGRALAFLGFGTSFALELDEEENEYADTPVKAVSSSSNGNGNLKVVEITPQTIDALTEKVIALLEKDKEAKAKLPKPVGEMNEDELSRTMAWLRNRASRVTNG